MLNTNLPSVSAQLTVALDELLTVHLSVVVVVLTFRSQGHFRVNRFLQNLSVISLTKCFLPFYRFAYSGDRIRKFGK